ncbi:MAG: ABC transporter permease [Clostridia bacterium]|nr:ABC transporter permease [Clostridia bacterium]
MNNKKFKILAVPYIVWMLIFTIIPLALILVFAFTDRNAEGFRFTFDNIQFAARYLPVLIKSVYFATVATIICLVVAYPLAYIMSKMRLNHQRTMVMLVMLPMWMNFLLRTYAWMSILETNSGFLNRFLSIFNIGPVHIMYTQAAVILGMVYNYIPYMILPLYTIMIKIDNRLIEAAQDLGCNTYSVFRKVIIPLSFPGITSGITMTFVPAVSTFVISQLLGGPKNNLIGDLIESHFVSGGEYNPYYGSAISLLLMVVVFICIGIFNQFDNEEMEETLK